MSIEPFIGEVMPWPGTYAPKGWAFCDGSLLPINQNTALFSLLGTMYGGNGQTTFALPDLRGRAPMHHGPAPGRSPRPQGRRGGGERAGLTVSHLPPHTHRVRASGGEGTVGSPAGNVYAGGGAFAPAPDATLMDANAVTPTGAGLRHPNMQPYLVINFVIALEGVFPSKS